MKQAIGVAQFQMHLGRSWKREPLEFLDPHLVVDQHELPAAPEEPTDIDLVRTSHGVYCDLSQMGAHWGYR
jgi:hypothetical protein